MFSRSTIAACLGRDVCCSTASSIYTFFSAFTIFCNWWASDMSNKYYSVTYFCVVTLSDAFFVYVMRCRRWKLPVPALRQGVLLQVLPRQTPQIHALCGPGRSQVSMSPLQQVWICEWHSVGRIYRACQKKVALKKFANFYNEILQLVWHLISRKSGKFCCIMCRIDKTTLLLIMTTWQFCRYHYIVSH